MDLAEVRKKIDAALEVAKTAFGQGKLHETRILCKQILKVDDEEPYAMQLLGLAEHRCGRYSLAIGIFKKLLEMDPNNAENHNNIALSYVCVGNLTEAIGHLRKAIAIRPDMGCFYSNLGLQYRNIRDYTNAKANFKKATEVLPDDPQAWHNFGACCGEMKELAEGEAAFHKALEINPDSHMSHVDLAYNLQHQERWKEAWEHYEHRFNHFDQLRFVSKVYDESKKWDGKESIADKRFLLYCEQGLGDAIMYARYIKYIKAKGAHTILHCYDTLEGIMKHVDGIDEITTAKIHQSPPEPLPEYDFVSSIMSLPLLLEKYEPFYEPYLAYDRSASLESYADSFNIGILWAGSPLHPEDAQRSCFMREFKVIENIPGVRLFNLQKDSRPRKYRYNEELVDFTEGSEGMKVIDASEYICDFEDLAAFINALDLVVSIDTAPVHLAGALEKPVMMAAAYINDPRWGKETTTPWYPTVKVFRQTERGNWKEVFERIANEITNLLQNKQ